MDEAVSTTPDGTRTAILEAARGLFVSQGYHGSSMRQIAAQAGIALGSIYNHFANKEDIFKHILWEYHPYRQVLQEVQQSQITQLENFLRFASQRMLSAINERPAILNLILIEVVEFNSQHIPEMFSSALPTLEQVFEQILISDPRIRDIDLPVLVRAFVGIFLSFYLSDKLLSSSSIPTEYRTSTMDDFVDIFLHGVLRCDPS
jgi:AcrR family transcriptional regulator